MRSSDIAKLAASVVAGYVTYDSAISLLEKDSDISLLDNFIAAASGGFVSGLVSDIMDSSGLSDAIDDGFGD